MASLSLNFFWVGFGSTLVATLAYLSWALGSLTVYRQAATNAFTLTVPVRIEMPTLLGRVGSFAARLALLGLTTSIILRGIAAGRPPLGNLWEFTVAFGWGIVLFTVLFEARFQQRAVSAFVMPVAATVMTVAVLFFPSAIEPLVPALQANRILGAHVTVMLLAYSAFSVSFGAALLYLVQISPQGRRFPRLPNGETLEDVAYWSVILGFPLLALGIALGAWWANAAWGRYWGWDPKETSALMTWFIYAGYLHAHNLKGWSGKRSAWLLVLGYAAVLFTYFAVNFWVAGLHSYAGV